MFMQKISLRCLVQLYYQYQTVSMSILNLIIVGFFKSIKFKFKHLLGKNNK